MSKAEPKSIDWKRRDYMTQNRQMTLTIPQKRQLRKTETRLAHQQQRRVHRETKRNRRQKFRDWMKGIR